ncbi:MAG TPA: hypothetical protein VLH41_10215 [Thermoanaerobaculia bacterium]|nr:hypothetical protein [Thermoanaerobaculia bacterium]
MTSGAGTSTDPAAALLARLKAFLLPGGEAPARGVARVRPTEKGEIRFAQNATN